MLDLKNKIKKYKNIIYIFFNEVSNALKGFLIILILSNFFSIKEFGIYSLLLNILAISTIFVLPRMSSTIITSIAKGFDKNYILGIKELFKWSILGSLILIITSSYFIFLSNEIGNFLYVLLLALIFPIYIISNQFNSLQYGKEKYEELFFWNLIINIIHIIIVLYFYLKKIFEPELLILIYITIISLIKLLLIRYYINKYKTNLSKENKKILNFAKKSSFSITFSALIKLSEQIIITIFLGVEKLAIYIIITQIPNQIKIFCKSINPIILTDLSKKSSLNRINTYIIYSLIITIIIIILYCLTIGIIFDIFYTKYADYKKLAIISSILLFIIPVNILNTYFQARLNLRYLNFIEIVIPIIKFSLIIPVTLKFGIIGVIFLEFFEKVTILIIGMTYINFNYKKKKN